MQPCAVHGFESEGEAAGEALAAALGVPFARVATHRFPDGEIMPVVPDAADTVIVHRSLHQPNDKLIGLLLAADAWRRRGVRRLVLVAPYLCYLRQDTVFAPGQPLSRDVVAPLLGAAFDRIVTVEAHLHRTRDLGAVFGVRAENMSSAPVLAEALAGSARPVVVGPDAEAAAWTEAFAHRLGADWLVFEKTRLGDRQVQLAAPDLSIVRGRPVLVVDDVVSSGGTLVAAARLLSAAGAGSIALAVAHALFDAEAEAQIRAAGVSRIISTDSIPHPTNGAPLARALADLLADEVHG